MEKEKIIKEVGRYTQAVVLSAVTLAASLPFAERAFAQSPSNNSTTENDTALEKIVKKKHELKENGIELGDRISDVVDDEPNGLKSVYFVRAQVQIDPEENIKLGDLNPDLNKKGLGRKLEDGSFEVTIPPRPKSKSEQAIEQALDLSNIRADVRSFIEDMNSKIPVGKMYSVGNYGAYEVYATEGLAVQVWADGRIELMNLGLAGVKAGEAGDKTLPQWTDDSELIKKLIAVNAPWSCQGLVVPATYYNLQGNRTANGEIMYAGASTTAVPLSQRHLMGKSARVTEMSSGASEIVRVNDTGMMNTPAYPGTWLDVTEGVAIRQGWKSRGKVTVCFEVLD